MHLRLLPPPGLASVILSISTDSTKDTPKLLEYTCIHKGRRQEIFDPNAGPIVGTVIGGIAVLGVIGLTVLCIVTRHARQASLIVAGPSRGGANHQSWL